MCAAQAAAVLLGLAVTACLARQLVAGPVIVLGIATVSVREGAGCWCGDEWC